MSLNLPSRRTLPLATQFSATPPARQRLRIAGLAREAARQPQHDLFGHLLHRGGQIHVALRQPLRRARAVGPPNSASNRSLVMVRPVQ